MKCPLKTLDNKVLEEVDLPEGVFGITPRKDILARVVHWQRAKARAGTHKTKGISDISGTTRKPFRQKGTGNARQGSLRSPQFRGGATIFGPVVRDHAYKLPKKIRTLGLKMALSDKWACGKVIIVDHLKLDTFKAKDLKAKLEKFGFQSALFIDGDQLDENFLKASRSLPHVQLLPQVGANVLSILKSRVVVLSKDALHHLEARLK